MNINERVKAVRNALGLTQIEFGSKTGISQGHLTSIESGKRVVTEKTLKVICATFNINEEWLRTGDEEMYADDDNVLLTQLAKKYDLDDFSRNFIKTFLGLSSPQREAIKGFVQSLSNNMNVDNTIQLYRAARSEENKEHEIVTDSQSKIERFKKLPSVTCAEDL